jgi:hypothetical protein
MRAMLARIGRMILALARELSDETAYARHLSVTGHKHSAAEWRSFSDLKHRQKYQNAKCC